MKKNNYEEKIDGEILSTSEQSTKEIWKDRKNLYSKGDKVLVSNGKGESRVYKV